MKRSLWKQTALLGSAAALLAGCAQPAAEPAFTVRKIDSLPASGDGTVRIKLTTPGDYAEADENLVVQYAQVVAVRVATDRQRQIAASRARATFQKIAARPATRSRKARYLAVKTEPGAAATEAPRNAPRSKTAGRSAPGARAAASIMIWDTQTQEIVGNKVYEVRSVPASGTLTRFETYTAEYVGSGL